jgi:hypothetical protein
MLTMLPPGAAVGDCIVPKALWKLEESGAAPEYRDAMNPGNHIGICRTDADAAVCPEPVPARYGTGQRFYVGEQPSGIDIPSSALFNWSSTDSFSIAFWMKRDNTPLTANEVIIGRDSTESENDLHWWIGVRKTGVAMAVFQNTLGVPSARNKYLTTDKKLTDDQWHLIVFVRDSAVSENRLYVDGHLEDKVFVYYSDAGFDADATPVNIGWLNLGSKYQYKGTVDEIAVYDTALPHWFIHDRYHADARYASGGIDPCE